MSKIPGGFSLKEFCLLNTRIILLSVILENKIILRLFYYLILEVIFKVLKKKFLFVRKNAGKPFEGKCWLEFLSPSHGKDFYETSTKHFMNFSKAVIDIYMK